MFLVIEFREGYQKEFRGGGERIKKLKLYTPLAVVTSGFSKNYFTPLKLENDPYLLRRFGMRMMESLRRLFLGTSWVYLM